MSASASDVAREIVSTSYLLDADAAKAYSAAIESPPRRAPKVNIHTDDDAARKAGYRAPIAAGEQTYALMANFILDSIRRRISTRRTSGSCAGETGFLRRHTHDARPRHRSFGHGGATRSVDRKRSRRACAERRCAGAEAFAMSAEPVPASKASDAVPAPRHTPIWKKALPYLGTVVIFALIFWRIPMANVGAALSRRRS